MFIVVLMCSLVAVLTGSGLFLLLSASTWRRVLGLGLLGNAVNFYLTVTGFIPYDASDSLTVNRLSRPAFVSSGELVLREGLTDPVPQALVLTAIVIGFAVLALGAAAWLKDES
jgi:multicomponent Na+:H+ antiporter subunit C